MIISKTPLRLNLCGGATDQKDYRETHGGVVITATINKYVYIIAKERFDNDIWLKYSKNETVKDINLIQNEVFRECLKTTGVTKGTEIVALSDVPKGYGLGGSSAFTIGLLNTLYALMGKYKSRNELAKEACEVGNKITKVNGFQDFHASSYGGVNTLEFGKEEISVEPIIMHSSLKRNLSDNLLLFDVGIKGEPINFLPKIEIEKNSKEEITHKIKEIVYQTRDALHARDLRKFGELLHENWINKKRVIRNISNDEIDRYYNLALEAGAIGGKICGTKERGFLLFYAEPEKQDKVREVLNLKEIPFEFEGGHSGSKIIYIEDK